MVAEHTGSYIGWLSTYVDYCKYRNGAARLHGCPCSGSSFLLKLHIPHSPLDHLGMLGRKGRCPALM